MQAFSQDDPKELSRTLYFKTNLGASGKRLIDHLFVCLDTKGEYARRSADSQA
jgi:hypothetical protein